MDIQNQILEPQALIQSSIKYSTWN